MLSSTATGSEARNVAMKNLSPSTLATGADFSVEYKAALEMQSAPPKTPGT